MNSGAAAECGMKPFLVASSAKVASRCAMSAAECDGLNKESIVLSLMCAGANTS